MRRTILDVEFLTPDPTVAAVAHKHRVELGLAGCPDEFTDWEPGPIWSIPDESPRIYIDISDTPAPIYEAVVATLGEPPL